jgi:hypothetical protein
MNRIPAVVPSTYSIEKSVANFNQWTSWIGRLDPPVLFIHILQLPSAPGRQWDPGDPPQETPNPTTASRKRTTTNQRRTMTRTQTNLLGLTWTWTGSHAQALLPAFTFTVVYISSCTYLYIERLEGINTYTYIILYICPHLNMSTCTLHSGHTALDRQWTRRPGDDQAGANPSGIQSHLPRPQATQTHSHRQPAYTHILPCRGRPQGQDHDGLTNCLRTWYTSKGNTRPRIRTTGPQQPHTVVMHRHP